MIVAMATYAKLPEGDLDDQRLCAAFRQRGVEIHQPSWDDPTFDWRRCDACLIRSTWDYQERLDEFLSWANRVASVTKLFNSFELVKWNTDKRYLRDLESKGVPVIASIWIDAGSTVDVRAELDRNSWKRAFLKPVVGSTARETLRFDSTQEGIESARRHLDRMLTNEDMVLQPYLEGVETEGELSAIFVDGTFTHAVRKTPVPGDYRVQEEFDARDEATTLSEEQQSLAHSVVENIDSEWLYARVDFLRAADGALKVSEVELVEPSLFFRHAPHAADLLAEALCKKL